MHKYSLILLMISFLACNSEFKELDGRWGIYTISLSGTEISDIDGSSGFLLLKPMYIDFSSKYIAFSLVGPPEYFSKFKVHTCNDSVYFEIFTLKDSILNGKYLMRFELDEKRSRKNYKRYILELTKDSLYSYATKQVVISIF